MPVVDPAHKGRRFEPFTFVIERGKLREFLLAVGDGNPIYQTEDPPLPPTYATVFLFWGGKNLQGILQEVGIEIWDVLHSEQEYEHFAPLHVGDMVTGQTTIADVYTRAGMDFVEIVTELKNQHGKSVINDRAVILVRKEAGS